MTIPVFARRLPAFVCLVFGIGLLTAPSKAQKSAPLMEINVRSSVDDLWNGMRKKRAEKHGQLYALISLTEAPATRKLARPVNQAELAANLRKELAKMGFREISAGEKAEVVLTVLYGRGYLRNPYLSAGIMDESDMVPMISLVTPKEVARHRDIGFEAKAQNAQLEKLFISISAFKYPENPGEKPKKLWKTTVLVDDPDNRDLNRVVPAMLAAGSQYFDRQMKEDQVSIKTPIPEGTVIIGPMKVIEKEQK